VSGNLYQLGKGLNLSIGAVVSIDGPHDSYGKVIKKQKSGYYLIRGIGSKNPKGL
jgi:hypothetical protein